MKKFNYFIIGCSLFLFSSLTCFSQSQSIEIKLDSIIQRVDSLEHELSYFKLTYELTTLDSDIYMRSNDVYSHANAIQINIYTRNFDPELLSAYTNYYDKMCSLMRSYLDQIEAKKTFFDLNISTNSFSDSEFCLLFARYKAIFSTYETLQSSMNLLKKTIQIYSKYC